MSFECRGCKYPSLYSHTCMMKDTFKVDVGLKDTLQRSYEQIRPIVWEARPIGSRVLDSHGFHKPIHQPLFNPNGPKGPIK